MSSIHRGTKLLHQFHTEVHICLSAVSFHHSWQPVAENVSQDWEKDKLNIPKREQMKTQSLNCVFKKQNDRVECRFDQIISWYWTENQGDRVQNFPQKLFVCGVGCTCMIYCRWEECGLWFGWSVKLETLTQPWVALIKNRWGEARRNWLRSCNF